MGYLARTDSIENDTIDIVMQRTCDTWQCVAISLMHAHIGTKLLITQPWDACILLSADAAVCAKVLTQMVREGEEQGDPHHTAAKECCID